jgi:ATP-dependent Lhr-like helicase
VTWIDWSRRRVFVEPAETKGRARWNGTAQPLSARLCESARQVLAGADPDVALTQRATNELGRLRAQFFWVKDGRTALVRDDKGRLRWWTFAGLRANWAFAALLADLRDQISQRDNLAIDLRPDTTRDDLTRRLATLDHELVGAVPVDSDAVAGLKFSACLPASLAVQVIEARLADPETVRATAKQPLDQATA